MQKSVTDYRHASFALKLILLRAGILTMNGVECMLTAIGTR